MSLRPIRILSLLLFALIPCNLAFAEKRIALIIAQQNYTNGLGELRVVSEDARLMEQALKSIGFSVTVVRNARTKEQLKNEVLGLANRLNSAGRDSIGFFYYSGHGAANSDARDAKNFLIPTAQSASTEPELAVNGLGVDDVLDSLEAAQARAIFVVLDACRDNSLALRRSGSKGLIPVSAKSKMLVAFATQPGQTAPADGIYARVLAEKLTKKNLSATGVFDETQIEVARRSPAGQNPTFNTALTESITFAQGSEPPNEILFGPVGPPPVEPPIVVASGLTPVGANKGGEGDVPEWNGGLTSPPSSVRFNPKTQLPPNPFPDDRKRFTVTASNLSQFEGRLTDGHKAMLRQYSSYKMDVYQSRRTCAYPQFVNAANANNASRSALTPDGDGITGGIMGFPFPVANPTGQQAVWNQRFRYKGFKTTQQFVSAPVQSNGAYSLITEQVDRIVRWSDPRFSRAEDLNSIGYYLIRNTVSPARLAGNVDLVHESINAAVLPRKAWSYNAGLRRVRVAPYIAYDNPGTNTDGMTTSDSFEGFNGAMDRYTWRSLGRQVKFIPYNNYAFIAARVADLVKPQHLNQDLVRYEPHRVWVVEATLKPANRHSYARRVMYLDEDSYILSVSDIYDSRGQLVRVQEALIVNFYHVPLCDSAGLTSYDMISGRYLASELLNEQPPPNYFADELNDGRYTPEAIRTLGVR